MLELEDIKSKIQEFERRQEEIDDYKKDLEEDYNILANDDENYRANNADVLSNGSQNPVKIQRERRERISLLLDERQQELKELKDEIAELEEKLNQEIEEFAEEIIEKIQEEKNRINAEVQEEVSINRLNAEKKSLENDRKRFRELIELAENRKVRADDSIYRDLKRREENANSRIAEIDKELEKLNPDRLSDLWDELDGYEKNMANLEGGSKDKIKVLCSTFDVKSLEQLQEEVELIEPEEPDKVEAEEPDEAEAEEPDEAEAEEPDEAEIAEPDEIEAEEPDEAEIAEPDEIEAEELDEAEPEEPDETEIKVSEDLMKKAMEVVAKRLNDKRERLFVTNLSVELKISYDQAVNVFSELVKIGVVEDYDLNNLINKERTKEVLEEYGIVYNKVTPEPTNPEQSTHNSSVEVDDKMLTQWLLARIENGDLQYNCVYQRSFDFETNEFKYGSIDEEILDYKITNKLSRLGILMNQGGYGRGKTNTIIYKIEYKKVKEFLEAQRGKNISEEKYKKIVQLVDELFYKEVREWYKKMIQWKETVEASRIGGVFKISKDEAEIIMQRLKNDKELNRQAGEPIEQTPAEGKTEMGVEAEFDEIEKGLREQAEREAKKDREETISSIGQSNMSKVKPFISEENPTPEIPKSATREPRTFSSTIPKTPKASVTSTTEIPSTLRPESTRTQSVDLDDGIDIDKEAQNLKDVLGNKSYKITIGKNGKIKVGEGLFGRSRKVDQEVYKDAAELNIYYASLSTEKFMDVINREAYSPDINKLIEVCKNSNVQIDFTIINSIKDVFNAESQRRDALIKGYIFNILGTHYDILEKIGQSDDIKKIQKYIKSPYTHNIDVTYNLDNLSGVSFKALRSMIATDTRNIGYMRNATDESKNAEQSWLDRNELTVNQKDRIAELATVANNTYQVADIKGTYHETLIAKIIRKMQSPLERFLPSKDRILSLNRGNVGDIKQISAYEERVARMQKRRDNLAKKGIEHIDVEPITPTNSLEAAPDLDKSNICVK